ncbi:MAG: AzlC family ABC transporter permease [Ruminococcus sp.]|uniref:AzlC family ABC transporter permease n=1 Tax=Ruminococcus sp. TaxID=41978 RepID=UPI00287361EF|nr:AzlC family ABC transporter permease [Ruminococcus sp.]MBQ3286013.1 AzlC family ABC transporter permease [Ruminococcus sp.]
MKKQLFVKGMRHGIPIMLGYLSVSFGFGVLCIQLNISILAAVGISVTNLTSAGQVAGVEIIAAGGSLIEMILCQLVINLRYSLMSLSLSQKLDPSFNLMHRLFVAYGVTDEIFAVASSQPEPLKPAYMYGLILTPFLGWSTGTLLGAVAGDIMPASVTAALSLMLYGMFIAIIIPPAKKNHKVLFVILIAAALSVVMHYLLPMITGGFAIIIAGVIASVAGALLFPVAVEERGEAAE